MINGISSTNKWLFWVDRGGTFTDAIGVSPDNTLHVTKVLSDKTPTSLCTPLQHASNETSQESDKLVDSELSPSSPLPSQSLPCYSDAVRAIRRILKLHPTDPFPSNAIDSIKIGTTAGTNALLERQGAKCLYITTRGFKDALVIRHQSRSDIFALNVQRQPPLYHAVIEIDERVTATGEVLTPLDSNGLESLRCQLKEFKRSDPTINSCAIVLLHSYLYPKHEIEVCRVCRQAGFEHVYPSHAADPVPKLISRAETTAVDAYLSPLLSTYISQLGRELETTVESLSQEFTKSPHSTLPSSTADTEGPRLFFTKSDGGLAEPQFFRGRDSLFSGPAGGVIGAWKVGQSKGVNRLISFDMGGTSTDVSNIEHKPTKRVECELGGISLCRSSIDVHSVANGGSSIVKFDGSRLLVGPESAGSFPGPACYRQNGPLTITDCNVILGRIVAGSFPKLFGENKNESIDVDIVRVKFQELQHQITQSFIANRNRRSADASKNSMMNGSIETNDNRQYTNSNTRNNSSTRKDVYDHDSNRELPEWIKSIEGIAEHFIEIAIQQMATAVQKITTHRGVFIGGHTLCCFGGAGGQHACLMAESLGLEKILIHPLASVLSAVGIGNASVTQTAQSAVGVELTQASLLERVDPLATELGLKLSQMLESQRIPIELQTVSTKLRVGYRNTDSILVIEYHAENAAHLVSRTSSDTTAGDDRNQKVIVDGQEVLVGMPNPDVKYISESLPFLPRTLFGRSAISLREEFLTRHQQEFGFCLSINHPIDIITLEVEATSESESVGTTLDDWKIDICADDDDDEPDNNFDNNRDFLQDGDRNLNVDRRESKRASFCRTFISGEWHEIPLLWSKYISASHGEIKGPAIIVDSVSTNVVMPGWTGQLDTSRCLLLTRHDKVTNDAMTIPTTCNLKRPSMLEVSDPFWLEFFNHYFCSVAQEMGVILQRTSQSINIKERLDFSCACFDSFGRLISNAPHIPVHLGSMGDSVVSLIRSTGGIFCPQQAFAQNNPFNGGTHLPDITVITPVFLSDDQHQENFQTTTTTNTTGCRPSDNKGASTTPIAFVVSRGHHTDVGGITPGSMPMMSSRLEEEGVVFDNVLLVDPVSGRFMEDEVMKVLRDSGKWPARNPALNIADLKAQIAANRRGVEELRRGVKTFGLDVMKAYMNHVLDGGEKAIRKVIRELSVSDGVDKKSFTYRMDGGSQICVEMKINQTEETISIDFTNTSPTDPFNYNAPMSVVRSAVLYVFRTLIKDPSVPLNEGCLRPLHLYVPPDCMLNPRHGAAVAAGNVEISQCVVNALFGCLGILAGSQGTMNNIAFGNSKFQYYETLAGGTGAGNGFNGCSAIHSHMTNSRITDTELMESRLPVIVLHFGIRQQTGGTGRYRGGDGVIRSLLFLDDVECSILSGHREVEPFGLDGGSNGAVGRNRLFVWIQNEKPTTTNELLNDLRGNIPSLINLDELQLAKSYKLQPLRNRDTVNIRRGDVLVIETPGGGGWGAEEQSSEN